MDIHIGQKIRQKAKELRIGPTELSKMINTSKQNIYGIYKRKSIDTGLLFNISQALNYNFFKYYLPDENILQAAEPIAEYSTKNELLLRQEIEHLKKEVIELKDKHQLLQKINTLLEKDKKR